MSDAEIIGIFMAFLASLIIVPATIAEWTIKK